LLSTNKNLSIMSTVNAIINENKITAQTIQRLIKASVGSAEVSAEVTMTNAVVASYTGGQITENGEVKASFNQYADGKMQISADVEYFSQAQAILTPFMQKMDAIALTMTEQPESVIEA